jgi:catechol 2,3-dioxygenase-like lactoylglutathione lyase family enzyme
MLVPGERRRVMQACWSVPDIREACRKWTETMGIGPFYLFENLHVDSVNYRGTPTSTTFSIAMAQAGGIQIELVEQHCDNPSAYRDLVAKGANGFHHIAIYVEDYDAALKHYTDKGFVAAIDGCFGEMRFAYVDTSAAIGCMVEIIEHHSIQDEIFARVIEGAANWDGVTDPIRPAMTAE